MRLTTFTIATSLLVGCAVAATPEEAGSTHAEISAAPSNVVEIAHTPFASRLRAVLLAGQALPGSSVREAFGRLTLAAADGDSVVCDAPVGIDELTTCRIRGLDANGETPVTSSSDSLAARLTELLASLGLAAGVEHDGATYSVFEADGSLSCIEAPQAQLAVQTYACRYQAGIAPVIDDTDAGRETLDLLK